MDAAVTVLVVGAGPTGLLLASELHRRNVQCLLIDAHDSPMGWDRATVVHPRSLEIFDSLGIVEPLLRQGVKQRRAVLHSDGAVLGEIDLSLCGSRYPFNIGISEEATESILTDYLARQGGEVTRSARLLMLEQREHGVLATIERDGTATQVSAQWVVGCDGHASMVRTQAGIGQDGHDIAAPWAVFDASVAGWVESYEGNYAYLDELPVILTALPGQRWRVYLRPSSPTSDLVADASSTLERYLPTARFENIENPTRFHCHSKIARQFRSGHILLAGDAAHTCSPAQGHGMNTGLQDAFNLAWKLALVCQGTCSPALLDSYEAERRSAAEMVIAEGDAAEAAQSTLGPDERQTRDTAIHAVLTDPTSRHHEAVAEAELDIDYSNSPIVTGDRHDALGPGQRLPDQIAVQSVGSGSCLLNDFANRRGHTALLIGGASTTHSELATVHRSIHAAADLPVLETTVALTAHPDGGGYASLDPASADRLGVSGITLLVVRPDGHVGLRADGRHVEALAAYNSLLGSAQPTLQELRGRLHSRPPTTPEVASVDAVRAERNRA